MKDYIINEDTYAIISYGDKSIVYEKHNKFIIDLKPNKILKRNCFYNGSSYEGRLNATKFLTEYNYKAPILIKEEGNIIFFPTNSPRLDNCSWISLNNIFYYYKNKDNKTCRVIFNNNLYIDLNISYNILNNQILRATNLDSKLRKKCL